MQEGPYGTQAPLSTRSCKRRDDIAILLYFIPRRHSEENRNRNCITRGFWERPEPIFTIQEKFLREFSTAISYYMEERTRGGQCRYGGEESPFFMTPEVLSRVGSKLLHNRRSGIQTWDHGFLSLAGAILKPPHQRTFLPCLTWYCWPAICLWNLGIRLVMDSEVLETDFRNWWKWHS